MSITYTTAAAKWNMNAGFGNHRMIVDAPEGKYVRVTLPWRRRDTAPENMAIRIRYNKVGEESVEGVAASEVDNIIIEKATRDEGVVVFESPRAGEYEIYYMPYEMPGEWYQPDVHYMTLSKLKTDRSWAEKICGVKCAEALRYEARTAHDSFYPMEMPMTAAERADFLAGDAPFVSVLESRTLSVRMFHDLPFIWNGRKADRG
ncbi:MAG: DUF6067 family protein, partial [Clostridia bacterium]|nr:DUF6067 family protein [Clostridia bacterium]